MNPGQLGVLIPIIALLIGGFAVFARSEIGRAFAHRLSGGATSGSRALEDEVHALRSEVEALRGEVLETQERLDFAERLLAGGRKES
jgi:hypothetical protein